MMRAPIGLTLAVVALLSSGACASLRPAPGGNPALESAAKRTLNDYVHCLYLHADAMAGGTGDPSEITDRTVTHCERHFARYCTATREYFTSAAPPDEQALAGERAQARCAETRENAREGLPGRIAREREIYTERRERAEASARDEGSLAR